MLIKDKAILQDILQKWLDKYADEIGSNYGIWKDDSVEEKNSLLLANACENVIDAMALQNELEQKFNS